MRNGQNAGLETLTQGEVLINFEIVNETLGKSKIIKFLVDTGFNGYLQLNESDVKELQLDLVNKHTTKGFYGKEVEVGITKAKVKVLDEEITNFPIQFVKNGVSLVGTRLLKDTKKMLIIDYTDGYVTITSNENLKHNIKTIVETINL